MTIFTTLTLSSAQLKMPCVYRVLNKNSKTVYVGLGGKGMGRVFNASPAQERRVKAFEQCKCVVIEFLSSEKDAENLEAELIHKFHPKYNGFCPHCSFYLITRGTRQQLQGRGVLFGKSRHAILFLLLGNPEKGYYHSEISQLTGQKISSLQRELKSLVKTDILRREKRGRQVFYQAETKNPFFNELRSMVLKGA